MPGLPTAEDWRQALISRHGEALQQRVAAARVIAAQPPLILADEPTGSLDRAAGDQVMALLGQMNRQGCAVVLITHDPRAAAQAPRRLRMENGRLLPLEGQ